MGVVLVTGSASGIGAATRAELERGGHHVLGVDLHSAEITADLATVGGRQAAVTEAARLAPRLDGVVACAGVGPQVDSRELIVSLNYFGAQQLLEGVHALLAGAPRAAAVAVASNSAVLPLTDTALVDHCVAGEEDAARERAAALSGQQVYASSKLALARWVRRQAHTAGWAGAGIRLNAVAPGAVETPLLQAGLDDPQYSEAIRRFPIPVGRFGQPHEIAAAIAFLLGPDASFIAGSVLFVDGGTDAMLRPDAF